MLARLRDDEADVQSGQFRFPAHQTSDEILRRLVSGAAGCALGDVPRGLHGARRWARGLPSTGSSTRALSTATLPARGSMSTVRGRSRSRATSFRAPTWFRSAPTPDRIARILTDQFFRELPADAAAKARALGLTVPQVITLASLIEREAQADDERALMAGVYYNRLRAGMPLEVDATIEYVFPEHHTVITRRDLEIDSPYNTYRHTGLPPTPIANPGQSVDRRGVRPGALTVSVLRLQG